jgi:hypothetical protein
MLVILENAIRGDNDGILYRGPIEEFGPVESSQVLATLQALHNKGFILADRSFNELRISDTGRTVIARLSADVKAEILKPFKT